jgi:hypothetical protein
MALEYVPRSIKYRICLSPFIWALSRSLSRECITAWYQLCCQAKSVPARSIGIQAVKKRKRKHDAVV